jgi:Protein of unknown function (DUF433)
MRVTVGMIVGQIGAGHTMEELLEDYPYLQREDILQALRYAACPAEERVATLAGAMKLLMDMNRSPRWGPSLLDAGHEVVRWSTVGKADTTDSGLSTDGHPILLNL